MKFSEFGPAMKTTAAVLSLGAAAFLAACGNHDTVDFVYVTNSKNNPGQINVYLARAQSGQLTQIPDSPYPSGGRNPVGLVTSPNYQNLYVINHDDNTIVQFGIGSDAKLYAQHTYNTPGTFPNAIAINSAEPSSSSPTPISRSTPPPTPARSPGRLPHQRRRQPRHPGRQRHPLVLPAQPRPEQRPQSERTECANSSRSGRLHPHWSANLCLRR